MTGTPLVPEVLVLTPDFPPKIGGIQTLVYRLVAGLSHFRPRVVTVATDGAAAFDRMQAFRVVRVSAGSSHRLGIVALNIAGIIEGLRLRPHVVLSAHIVAGPGALAAGRVLGRPVVQYVHAAELSHRTTLVRQVLGHADLIVTGSRYSQALVEQTLGHRGRIRVIHPGVDCAQTPPEPAMANSAIVVVARLTERYKGHDVLLRALALVRDRVSNANLHVVGDGRLRPELEKLAQELEVSSATTFHGTVTDARRDAILSQATVFAMPSRIEGKGVGEGFGIAYVEAGAQGLPVVAGNAGGALDAVVDGETGLLVDPENPQAVADALSVLLEDRERARQMGRAGWEHARSLSWARTASEIEGLLDEVITW